MNKLTDTNARIAGIGIAIPDKTVTNFDLEKIVDTNDEWIRTRTGIRERRFAEENDLVSEYGARAAREAMRQAGVEPDDIDLVIVATSTPDMPFPSTACLVQNAIEARNAAAFDLAAACSGFVYALTVGSQFIEAGTYRNVLVIGADFLSRNLDFQDRSTCILFGDGAGAVLLQPTSKERGILAYELYSDGSGGEMLYIATEGSAMYQRQSEQDPVANTTLRMNGREVFRFAVKAMGDAAETVLQRAGLEPEDVTLFVPHQANIRIIEATARRFHWPLDKVIVNLDRYGNTSAASIPIALYEAYHDGRIRTDDVVLFVAVGGGMTWGAVVLRW